MYKQAHEKTQEEIMQASLEDIVENLKEMTETMQSNDTIQMDKDGKVRVKGLGIDKKHFVDTEKIAELVMQYCDINRESVVIK